MLLKLFIFEIMLFISYIFYRFLARQFNLRVKNKSFERHSKDIIDLLIYGFIIFIFIFFKNNANYFDKSYIIYFFISLVMFGLILEIPGVDSTVPNFKNWNSNKIVAVISLLVLTYVNGKSNFVLNKRNGGLMVYLIIFSMVTSITSYQKNKMKTFHPHHWQIFWFLSLIMVPNLLKTKILSAMYVSFFAHGIIAHSAASILKDE